MPGVLVLLAGMATPAAGHPAVSVVIDSRGNVYYSDLRQVWRISPDGRKSVAVPNVHSHELALDAADNLFGEHLWYEGEKIDKWGHYVWKRTREGKVTYVIPPREGFLENYSFVRDRRGTMYWADRDASVIRKRLPDGRVEVMARYAFGDVRWMTVSRDGVVYLIDKLDLLRVSPGGEVKIIAPDISYPRMLRLQFGHRHVLMGLWLDDAGNVYVADNAGRQVKRVGPAGRVDVIARSTVPWAPAGGTFGRNGDLWLMECSTTNQVRVRRIARGGRETIY